MGSTKEIQTRMKSIQDTMKITNAMYMISSSKMQKAKRILSDTEPYYYNMQAAISRILRHMPDTEHPFFSIRHKIAEEDRKIGCIVVTEAFQLLQHPLYIFLLIVCRNDNQQFFLFLLYHRIFLILSRKAAAPTAVPRSRNLQDTLTPPARTPCAGPDSGSGSPQLPLPPQRQARTKSRPPRL